MPIPPLPESRKRAIARWLEDFRPEDYKRMKREGTLEQTVEEMDDQMWEEFLESENTVLNQLINEGIQGTEEGLREYRTRLAMNWAEIFNRHLPAMEPSESPE